MYSILAFRARGTCQVLRNSFPSTVLGNMGHMLETRHSIYVVPIHNVDCYNSALKVTSGPSTESQTKSAPHFCLGELSSKQLLSAMELNAKAGLKIVLCQPAVHSI